MTRTTMIALGFSLLLASTAAAQTPPSAAPAPQAGLGAGPAFVDADGDGICDLKGTGSGERRGTGYGPGDGTGNGRVGPRDGSGYGPGAGTANCTGTGQGRQARQGQARGRR
jgi:hypothetical protein